MDEVLDLIFFWIIGRKGESSHNLHYLGVQTRTKTQNYIAQSSAVLLLSQYDKDGFYGEGLGLSLLEAAAQGIMGIGSQTGGIPEAIGPGILIDTHNLDTKVVQEAL